MIVGKDKEIVSTGIIRFHEVLRIMKRKTTKTRKYFGLNISNEIFNIQFLRIGVSTKDCTMYLSCGIPCSDCCRGIINILVLKEYFVNEVMLQKENIGKNTKEVK